MNIFLLIFLSSLTHTRPHKDTLTHRDIETQPTVTCRKKKPDTLKITCKCLCGLKGVLWRSWCLRFASTPFKEAVSKKDCWFSIQGHQAPKRFVQQLINPTVSTWLLGDGAQQSDSTINYSWALMTRIFPTKVSIMVEMQTILVHQ